MRRYGAALSTLTHGLLAGRGDVWRRTETGEAPSIVRPGDGDYREYSMEQERREAAYRAAKSGANSPAGPG
jgi:hypothetical protein